MSTDPTDPLDEIGNLDEATLIAELGEMDEAALEAALCDWQRWARPCIRRDDGTYGGQTAPPGDWDTWLILAGRGFGKGRSAAEYVRDEVKRGRRGRWAFVAKDPGDARDTMIDGESGICPITPKADRPYYNPSTKILRWPNGAQARIASSWDPDELRGPNIDGVWGDEFASWKYQQETWTNINLVLRKPVEGDRPRAVISTTPRPGQLLRSIMADPGTVITTGSTYENRRNLAEAFFAKITRLYEGTSLGAQELYARVLDEVQGALWDRETIERYRLRDLPDVDRVVVAVDPMARTTDDASKRKRVAPPATGIVICGALGDVGYVLGDRTQTNSKPDVWGRAAVQAYHDFDADVLVAEVNNGGDMVEHVIKTIDPTVRVKQVTATKGKRVRAEPISSLAQQGRFRHVGVFGPLEDELCTWSGEDNQPSPNRLDAAVWAGTYLLLGRSHNGKLVTIDPSVGYIANPWRIT